MDVIASFVPWAWGLWVVWCLGPWRPPAQGLARPDGRATPAWPVVLGVVAGAAALAVLVGAFVAAAAVGAALLVVAARRRRARQLEAARAAAAVPDVGELLRIGVAAGLTPVLALDQVARYAPTLGPGREAAQTVLAATARGQPLADALDGLVAVLGEHARPLVDALAATDRYGVPLEPALERAVADLRRRRRADTAAAARRLPVLLSFPLVGCVLPAFALLTLAPLVAGAIGALGTSVPTVTTSTTGGTRHAPSTRPVPPFVATTAVPPGPSAP